MRRRGINSAPPELLRLAQATGGAAGINQTPRPPSPKEQVRPATSQAGYFTGIIRCSYGLPGHMTYGFVASASGVFA